MEVMGNFIPEADIRIHRQSDLMASEQAQRLIKMRWWAPALILAAVGLSVLGGLNDRYLLLLWAAGYILVYNLLFYRVNLRTSAVPDAVCSGLQRRMHVGLSYRRDIQSGVIPVGNSCRCGGNTLNTPLGLYLYGMRVSRRHPVCSL